MKAKFLLMVVAVVAIALAAALYFKTKKAEEKFRDYEASIVQLSNEWKQTSSKLTAQTEVNALLETNLTVRTAETVTLSNQLTNLTVTLAKTEADAKAAAKAAEEELARRDSKIKELENQNDGLSKTMEDLKGSITTLESRIADTQKKLATSQGEKEFLVKELKRLQAEKAELERQFNDLSAVREQVRKLRDELSIARRLDWIRRGLYGNEVKGGQRLQQGFTKPAGTNDTNAYNLNVEIKREGGAKVVPPAAPATPEKK